MLDEVVGRMCRPVKLDPPANHWCATIDVQWPAFSQAAATCRWRNVRRCDYPTDPNCLSTSPGSIESMTGCQQPPTIRAECRLAARIGLAALSMVLFTAGCGGSASTTSSAITIGSVPAKFRNEVESGLEYSKCMRTHGVPNFADPKIRVSATELIMQNPQMSPTEVASPAYQSAAADCARYLPQQSQAPAVTGAGNSQQQALRFSDCMRSHGVPNFPDPTVSGAFKLGPAIDPQAPAFTAAMRDCRNLRPATLQFRS